MHLISVVQLGTVDYATGLRLQQQLVDLRKADKIGDVLLLLEHSPVITLGRNAKADNVIASPELLSQRGVELFECDRGGDVTFHGPGQIVGYPIFDLRSFATPDGRRKTLGAVEFVRRLEEVLIRTCADFAIPTKRIPSLTGVWTGHEVGGAHPEAKLAAIGIHISRFVTSHGFALNVNTDLSFFNLIVPCGIVSKPVTSMQQETRTCARCQRGRRIHLPQLRHRVFQSNALGRNTRRAARSRRGRPPAASCRTLPTSQGRRQFVGLESVQR